MNIIRTTNSEELSEWDIERVRKINAEYFVYNYHYESWEGSGWAIWKMPDGNFGYTSLSHCSCNGPVEDIESIPYTFEQVKEIANKHYSEYAKEVLAEVEKMEQQ